MTSEKAGSTGRSTSAEQKGLEAQIRAAHAPPGSALEALIRHSQDASILKGEPERADLPLWLRVYWRRAHPHSKSYPLSLNRIHAWLLANPDHENLRRSIPRK